MEYMFVIGLSLLFLIPLVSIFFYQINGLQEEIAVAQVERVSEEIISSAEEVFYLGPPSQVLLEVYFPDRVDFVTLSSQSISVAMLNYNYEYYAVSSLPLNLSGSIKNHRGLHNILITAYDNNVSVTET